MAVQGGELSWFPSLGPLVIATSDRLGVPRLRAGKTKDRPSVDEANGISERLIRHKHRPSRSVPPMEFGGLPIHVGRILGPLHPAPGAKGTACAAAAGPREGPRATGCCPNGKTDS
jgi:hypothetical protein